MSAPTVTITLSVVLDEGATLAEVEALRDFVARRVGHLELVERVRVRAHLDLPRGRGATEEE